MQNNGLVTILSADRDFEAFSFVERIDPLDYVPRH
jgi:hypothetical protein